ncbi:MAG TPA: gliding-motility protein MglA [Candidatus Melainabacteria bacterium]|jgi:mutual gliding-motility protein MglA|nr:gliding-motility protein MglA [Candidatus Melainabacteria bacterium]HIN65251.1 gliding-motility protein MglA [Candidatus Obscuribacterales bacterium]
MALINYPKREIVYKVVYYGTGLGGKTTNLRYLHANLDPSVRGELVTVATETERTLFFDFMPLDLGEVEGYKARFALYTVPGQVEYGESRRMILKGADGIIFVADSSAVRRQANVEALQGMMDNLKEHKLSLTGVPWVLQYNKRDLTDALPIETLEKDLNQTGVPSFEAVATEGKAVFGTLKTLSQMVVQKQ